MNMRKVLVMRFSSLGDVVMASAVVEAIYRHDASCGITMLTKEAYAPLFSTDHRVERVEGIRDGEPPSVVARRFDETFDAVIDLHGSLRSIAVATFLRSPRKLRLNKHALARRVMIVSRNRFRMRFDVLASYLDTIRPLGIRESVLPRIVPGERALRAGTDMLSIHRREGGKVIGIAPGSLHPEKRWSPESYALLADRIVARGDMPIFIGDRFDTKFIRVIISRMTGDSVSLAGEIDLLTTAGVIALLDGLVCNDSGPMHLAGALGTPFAAIFGPTHPDLGFTPGYPWGAIVHSNVHCSPCSLHGRTPCRYPSRRCMEGITGDRLLRELDRMIEAKRWDQSEPFRHTPDQTGTSGEQS